MLRASLAISYFHKSSICNFLNSTIRRIGSVAVTTFSDYCHSTNLFCLPRQSFEFGSFFSLLYYCVGLRVIVFSNFCSSSFKAIFPALKRRSIFVLAFTFSFQMGNLVAVGRIFKFLTRLQLLYLFELSGFNFKYFFIESC